MLDCLFQVARFPMANCVEAYHWHTIDHRSFQANLCSVSAQVVPYEYPKESIPEYSSILVPNVDNVRTDFLVDTIAKQGKVIVIPYSMFRVSIICAQPKIVLD